MHHSMLWEVKPALNEPTVALFPREPDTTHHTIRYDGHLKHVEVIMG